MSSKSLKVLLVPVFAFCALSARAQMPATPYGPAINLEDAKKVADLAVAEASKNKWKEIVAIVDSGGNLVYFVKMDLAQTGSVNVAISKARSAAMFRRPTKVFQDALIAGGSGLRFLGLEGAVPLDGGLPLVMDGKIVGGIGVSGDTGENDGKCAKAGADVLK